MLRPVLTRRRAAVARAVAAPGSLIHGSAAIQAGPGSRASRSSARPGRLHHCGHPGQCAGRGGSGWCRSQRCPGRRGRVPAAAPRSRGRRPLEVDTLAETAAIVVPARSSAATRLAGRRPCRGTRVQVDLGPGQRTEAPHRVPERLVALGLLGRVEAGRQHVPHRVRFHHRDRVAVTDGRGRLAGPRLVAGRRRPAGRGEVPACVAVRQVVSVDDGNRARLVAAWASLPDGLDLARLRRPPGRPPASRPRYAARRPRARWPVARAGPRRRAAGARIGVLLTPAPLRGRSRRAPAQQGQDRAQDQAPGQPRRGTRAQRATDGNPSH